MVVPKSGKNKRHEYEDIGMKLVGDGSNLSMSGEDYDKKYKNLLDKYNLKREKNDYEKDMDEYGPRIKAAMDKTKEANKSASMKDTSRPTRDAESMKGVDTKVKTSGSGYAEAETTPAKNRTTASKNRPSTMPSKGGKLENRGTNTSAKGKAKPDKPKGTMASKAKAKATKTVYSPENQDVKGSWADSLYNPKKGKTKLTGAKLNGLSIPKNPISDFKPKGSSPLGIYNKYNDALNKKVQPVRDVYNKYNDALNKKVQPYRDAFYKHGTLKNDTKTVGDYQRERKAALLKKKAENDAAAAKKKK